MISPPLPASLLNDNRMCIRAGYHRPAGIGSAMRGSCQAAHHEQQSPNGRASQDIPHNGPWLPAANPARNSPSTVNGNQTSSASSTVSTTDTLPRQRAVYRFVSTASLTATSPHQWCPARPVRYRKQDLCARCRLCRRDRAAGRVSQ